MTKKLLYSSTSSWSVADMGCRNDTTTTGTALFPWTRSTSLLLLSYIWLALCTGLVWKYNELVVVFFSFLANFLCAGSFMLIRRAGKIWDPSSRHRDTRASKTRTANDFQIGRKSSNHYTTATDNNNNNSKKHVRNGDKECSRTRTRSNGRIRAGVGAINCILSLWILMGRTDSTTTQSTSRWFMSKGESADFVVLCVMTGFLAFDHWYSPLCCEPPAKPLSMVVEDAISLTIAITVIVLHLSMHDGTTMRPHLILGTEWSRYRTLLVGWVCYKLLMFLGQWQWTRDGNDPIDIIPHLPVNQREVHGTINDTNNVQPAKTTYVHADQPASNLWLIRGVSYDMTEYVHTHPGGAEAILLGQGRDCTALFESYHPFTSKHKRILEKYRMAVKPQAQAVDDVFYTVLCQRVEKTLRDQGFDPITDRAATWQRSAYYLLVLVAVIVSGRAHANGSILGSFALAVFGWMMGALGHDAGHFAASRKSWINDIGVLGISLLCNPIMWQHQHTYAHHSHTNSFDHDPDMHHFTTLLRVHKRFQQKGIYKFQRSWLFVAFAYTFVCFGTCVWIPVGFIMEGSLYGMVEWTDRRRPLRALGMWLHLVLYTFFIMIWPFLVHTSYLAAWSAMTVHLSTTGLIFAIFSQINHLNEASLKTNPHADNPTLKHSWAVAQVESSNNFCPQSFLWHFLSNGLNLQIEHHLFPALNHCHLPRIQPVVQTTCAEFGVAYKSYDSWKSLMNATLKWLKQLSDEPATITS